MRGHQQNALGVAVVGEVDADDPGEREILAEGVLHVEKKL